MEFEQIFVDNPSLWQGRLQSFSDELQKTLTNSIEHNSQVNLTNFTKLFCDMVIAFMVQKKYPTSYMSLVWDWHEQTRDKLKRLNLILVMTKSKFQMKYREKKNNKVMNSSKKI